MTALVSALAVFVALYAFARFGRFLLRTPREGCTQCGRAIMDDDDEFCEFCWYE